MEKKIQDMVEAEPGERKHRRLKAGEREQYRERVAEYRLQGFEYNTIAEGLGLSVKQVRKLDEEAQQDDVEKIEDPDIGEVAVRRRLLLTLIKEAVVAAYSSKGNVKTGFLNSVKGLMDSLGKLEAEAGITDRRKASLETIMRRRASRRDMTREELNEEQDRLVEQLRRNGDPRFKFVRTSKELEEEKKDSLIN